MSYVLRTEAGPNGEEATLVGYWRPDGIFEVYESHEDYIDAEQQCSYLNGGMHPDVVSTIEGVQRLMWPVLKNLRERHG